MRNRVIKVSSARRKCIRAVHAGKSCGCSLRQVKRGAGRRARAASRLQQYRSLWYGSGLPRTIQTFRKPEITRMNKPAEAPVTQALPLPLSRITVLDLTLARAGPTCVRHLADWGATIIRIEPAEVT